MRQRPQRARRRPGPLVFIVIVIGLVLALRAVVVRAHDPGLSSLELSLNGTTIAASIAISAADVAQIAEAASADASHAVRHLVRGAVRVSIDGASVAVVDEDVVLGAEGARVHLSYAPLQSSLQTRRIEVVSELPSRISRGHRQLLVVVASARIVAERVLDPTTNSVAVDLVVAQPSLVRQAWSYFTLGVHHILSGYDHLVFLAGVILGAASLRALVIALTAFTAAHSVSLALVVLAGVDASPAIVEPLIAASIAWIGIENLWRERLRPRWWLVFAFGLIHGFGFAGALTELGLGSRASDVAVALLSFNGGVEAGQLAVSAALLPLVSLMRARPVWQARLAPLCSALIVIAGGCWLIGRLWAIFIL
jgi:hydrogenase/urease accessory protein HupE